MYSSLIHLLQNSIYDLVDATQHTTHIKNNKKAVNFQKKTLSINFLQIDYFVKQKLLMFFSKFINFGHN